MEEELARKYQYVQNQTRNRHNAETKILPIMMGGSSLKSVPGLERLLGLKFILGVDLLKCMEKRIFVVQNKCIVFIARL